MAAVKQRHSGQFRSGFDARRRGGPKIMRTPDGPMTLAEAARKMTPQILKLFREVITDKDGKYEILPKQEVDINVGGQVDLSLLSRDRLLEIANGPVIEGEIDLTDDEGIEEDVTEVSQGSEEARDG
jgi:hypothetical protein